MDYFNNILDFSHGQLSDDEESMLFAELSSNKELRQDFKQHLEMKTAISTNAGAFAPPVELSMGVFGKLGFSPSNYNVQIPGGVSTFFSKFRQGFFASSITAIIAVIIYIFLLQNNPAPDFASYNGFKFNNVPLQLSDKAMSAAITSMRKESENRNLAENDNQNNVNNIPIKTKIKYVYIQKPVYVDRLPDTVEDTPAESMIAEQAPEGKIMDDILIDKYETPVDHFVSLNQRLSNNTTTEDNSILQPELQPELYGHDEPGILSDLSIEYRGSQYMFNTSPRIQPKEYAKFNNTSLSLKKELNDEFSAGAELRIENFYVEYESSEESGQRYLFEQMPNLTTISGFVRYTPLEYYNFEPFLQLNIGANYYGFVGRGMVGTEYRLGESISLLAGWEYSNLWFDHKGNVGSSGKWGFNYGISFNL